MYLYPRSPKGEGVYCFTSVRLSVLPSVRPSVRPSKIFFVAFFSVTVDGRNLIFSHKRHIGKLYCGWHFWTHQIPTSCLPTYLVFIHIEHICTFFVTFFSATIDGRNLIFGHKLHIGTPYHGKRFLTHPIRFLLPVCRLTWFLYTLNIYAHFSSHFSQQLLMAEIWYLVTSFI